MIYYHKCTQVGTQSTSSFCTELKEYLYVKSFSKIPSEIFKKPPLLRAESLLEDGRMDRQTL